MLPDQLQITYQSVNIDLDSSLKNLQYVYVVIILLRWENTFFLSVYSIKSLRIQKENCLKIFSLFQSSILEFFVFRKVLYKKCFFFLILLSFIFSFSFSFYFFIFAFLLLLLLSSYFSSYIVITTVYHYILCNKLLIFLKKRYDITKVTDV